jgi:hypothetical protein
MKVVVLFIIGPKDVQITMFRATMLVMRAEDWWVKAESFEKAEALAAGQGHRAALGELVVPLEAVRSDDDSDNGQLTIRQRPTYDPFNPTPRLPRFS